MSWLTILGFVALGIALCIAGFYMIMMLTVLGVFGKWRR